MESTSTSTTPSPSSNLQSLIYSNKTGSNPTLSVLDQLLVPHEKVYVSIPDVEAAWSVIRSMQIRGAPLIAIVACLGLAVDLATNPSTLQILADISEDDLASVRQLIQIKIQYLQTSRPTAVNLFNAMTELQQVMDQEGQETKQQIIQSIIAHAEFMLQRDVSDNKAIGSHGAKAILDHYTSNDQVKRNKDNNNNNNRNIRLVTICNTGSLATAHYGTALGVARALHSMGRLESIHCLETRPYNQGSRLTAFEILEEQMPNGTLICDSAAAALMRVMGVDAVVVGADRVCSNGDTANKIGTYMLALVAKEHNVPFYVAAPFTTLDTSLENGDCIEIEERPGEEIIDTSKAPKNMKTWNPAFDVTPAKYITGIITEKGMIVKMDGEDTFDVAKFVQSTRDI